MSNKTKQDNKANSLKARLIGINEVQRLHLRLMEIATFNEYDGQKVVSDLLNNLDLWDACLMDRAGGYGDVDLIKLRDMSQETRERLGYACNNVDTLYILPKKGKWGSLDRLAHGWHSDEIDWIMQPRAGNLLGASLTKDAKILKIWWD